MSKLPKRFPEYSIMYKTIQKQIKKLEEQKKSNHKNQIKEIQMKIEKYQSELKKIRKMFPDNFLED